MGDVELLGDLAGRQLPITDQRKNATALGLCDGCQGPLQRRQDRVQRARSSRTMTARWLEAAATTRVWNTS